MQLVSDYMDSGVVSVVVMDDGGIPELLPVMEPDNIEVTRGSEEHCTVAGPDDAIRMECVAMDERDAAGRLRG